jgi:hypothetical protein
MARRASLWAKLSGVIYYFESKRDAHEILDQCERENRVADLEMLAT